MMITKAELLSECREDIQNPKYDEQAPLWLEYRKIEVFIDIRDIFYDGFLELDKNLHKILDKT